MTRVAALIAIAMAVACGKPRSDAPAQGTTTQGTTTKGSTAQVSATQGSTTAAAPGTQVKPVAPVAPVHRADTAVGRVAQVGPDPVAWMALALAGGTQLRLSGPGAATLRAVSGAQVWVTGVREANGFRVDEFEVRRVNDQPVDDGIVVVTSDAVGIRMRSGVRREVLHAPSLRDMPGARIWVTRPVAGVAPSFGVITKP